MTRILFTLPFMIATVLSAADGEAPNIVFILADDLGYGDVGCYGSTVNRTPHLDRLAASGMQFTDFHSNGPMCSPTRAAFLTGLYQNRFGRRFESALSGARRDAGLPLSAVTIAERLKQAGYATGVFGKWHLGYEAPYLPTNQGFDGFRGLVSGDGDHHTQIDEARTLDGINLSSLVFDGERLPERTLFWRMGSSKAVRRGAWKLCVRGRRPPELYNLATDLGEQENLAGAQPTILSDLQKALSDWEVDVDRSVATKE